MRETERERLHIEKRLKIKIPTLPYAPGCQLSTMTEIPERDLWGCWFRPTVE